MILYIKRYIIYIYIYMKKTRIDRLGIPYMGSKREIAKDLVDFILKENPNCKYVYDLFAGGVRWHLNSCGDHKLKEWYIMN